MSSVTTHDLPPTAGYLAGDQVRLRESLGLLTNPVEAELESARADRAAWMAELRRVGLLADGAEPDSEEAVLALYRYLGRTPSRLLAVALTDAVGDRRTQNQPGTTDEYPNWRVALTRPDGPPMLLADLFTDRRAATLAGAGGAAATPPLSCWGAFGGRQPDCLPSWVRGAPGRVQLFGPLDDLCGLGVWASRSRQRRTGR